MERNLHPSMGRHLSFDGNNYDIIMVVLFQVLESLCS